MTTELAEELLACWVGDALESPHAARARCKVWFGNDPDFDSLLRERFGDLPERARAGELDGWSQHPRFALAQILALDQIPRNIHRGSPKSFAFDAAALTSARDAVAQGYDRTLHPLEAVFIYLPFEHAEDLTLQMRSVALFAELQSRAPPELGSLFAGFTDYARRHHDVVARFGRFPHRNEVLGRPSTADEVAYLREGGERFGARIRSSGSSA